VQASFIIPLYNCLAHTREALRTLQATLPPGLEHEVILVDDGSTDGTREWLATLPAPCRPLLNERNLGFAGACNRGAAAARGRRLYFLNNDLVFLPGWFEGIETVFARRPDAGLVGNVQLNAATGAVDHCGVAFDHKGKPRHLAAPPLAARWSPRPRILPVAALTGACFALDRALWLALGGFDEGYRNGGEDIDLAFQAAAAGRRQYVALDSVVRHHVSASPGRKLRDEQNTWRLFQRWPDQLAALAVRAWSGHYLAQHWDGGRNADDFAAAIQVFAYWLRLRRTPPLFAQDGVRRALDAEVRRWRDLGITPPA
jgi:GT2 family glycosyltransferase